MLVLKPNIVRRGVLTYQLRLLLSTPRNHRCDAVIQAARGEANLAQLCCCEILSDVSFVVSQGLRVDVGSFLHTVSCLAL